MLLIGGEADKVGQSDLLSAHPHRKEDLPRATGVVRRSAGRKVPTTGSQTPFARRKRSRSARRFSTTGPGVRTDISCVEGF